MAFNGIKKDRGLTTGNITLGLLWFAVPMILGNLLQQFYNIADTLIVGQFLGANALAAVGSLVDDISDFGTFGVVHGEWGHFFSAIWGGRPGGIET